MGKVYVGQDVAGTLAAVKVLKPELAHEPNLAQRFVREAQAAQAVRSKGVAAVLGAWTEGGRPWIATEFLAGLTLDQAVEAYGPLDGAAVRALASALAQTLADIHAVGFVHRDLKPPNIVLTSDGPRIIDFGIARPEHGLTLTTTGQVPVTPGYGAPEQVLGQRVTPSADVFSLGAVLAYAASGRRAYEGTHIAAVQYAVVHGEPQLGGIAPEIHALIAPCLAKDPATRPVPAQIVQAMAAPKGAERTWRRGPLADAIKERETAAHRLTAHVTLETAPSVTRRCLLAGLTAGAVVVAGGGGTAAWWLGSRSSQGEGSARAKRDPFDIPAAVPTPMARLDTKGGENILTGAKQPTMIWRNSDTADVYSRQLLPVRDVIVLGAATGGIAAYDVRDGSTRWSASNIRTKGGYLSLSDRLVIGADKQGVLRTFVPSTGTPMWTCPAAEAATLLAADNEVVYFVTLDDKLRSVSRADSKVRWTATVPSDFRKKLLNPAAIGQGKLVMSTSDGNVLVVRTSDGRKEWARLDHADVTVRPAVYGDTVYINAKDLEARRLSDGKLIWRAHIYKTEKWGPPEAHANVVYANGGDDTMCLDTRDGSQLWQAYNDVDQASPALLQGNAVWALQANSNSRSPSVEVSAIRSFDGEEKWTYSLPAATYLRMAADGNRVFVMKDSMLVAFSTF